jgi:class 3 adenylate cyclase
MAHRALYRQRRPHGALGGHVPKKLGDGLMALFGYPQAQENDAERAVTAFEALSR